MLKRNSAYFISFKYRVLKLEKDATLCLFLRSPTARVFTDKGWKHWREGQGKVKEALLYIMTGNADDYQIHIQVAGRGKVVIDDFVVWRPSIEPGELPPPSLVCPEEGARISPESAQFVWTVCYPATEYEVQFSKKRNFSRPLTFVVPIHGCLLYTSPSPRDRG